MLIPLYLYFFGVESYGYWIASAGAVAYLGMVDFGTGKLATLKISSAKANDDFREALGWLYNGYFLSFSMLSILGFIVLLLSNRIVLDLGIPEELGSDIHLGILFGVLNFLFSGLNDIARGACYGYGHSKNLVVPVILSRLFWFVVLLIAILLGGRIYWISLALLIENFALFILYNHVFGSLNKFSFSYFMQRNKLFFYLKSSPRVLLATLLRSLEKSLVPYTVGLLFGPTVAAGFGIVNKVVEVLNKVALIQIGSAFTSLVEYWASGRRLFHAYLSQRIYKSQFFIGLPIIMFQIVLFYVAKAEWIEIELLSLVSMVLIATIFLIETISTAYFDILITKGRINRSYNINILFYTLKLLCVMQLYYLDNLEYYLYSVSVALAVFVYVEIYASSSNSKYYLLMSTMAAGLIALTYLPQGWLFAASFSVLIVYLYANEKSIKRIVSNIKLS